MGRRRFKRRSQKKKNRIGKILFLLTLALGVYAVIKVYGLILKDNIKKEEPVYLYIPSGASYETVIDSLEKLDVLKSFTGFDLVAKLKSYPDLVKPGRYKIGSGLSNNELVNKLRSGDQEVVQLTFNNLEDIYELAGIVSRQIEADSASLVAEMTSIDVDDFEVNSATLPSLFLPNTYQFYWNTDADGFVRRMVLEFNRFWNNERKSKAKSMNLTIPEVVTLASIVHKETVKPDERKRVAGLYVNRIRKNWKLQSDPTVIFAVKKKLNKDTIIRRVLYKDLRTESPYNTYLNPGIPPGPICIPPLGAIDAVLYHEEHEYMYMCAREDFSGYHNFAITASQHAINRAKYTKELDRRNIKR